MLSIADMEKAARESETAEERKACLDALFCAYTASLARIIVSATGVEQQERMMKIALESIPEFVAAANLAQQTQQQKREEAK
jgi:hypothetical protein